MTADAAPTPSVTIVVCTVPGRRAYLEQALESLVANDGIEDAQVLLVAEDRAFLDEMTAAFADRLPLATAVSETKGLSDKRNVGAREASGDVVAYLDDDAIAAPDYVAALQGVFAGDATVIAGAIEPIFEAELPAALRDSAFRIGGFNRWEGREDPTRWIGANCAFRRDVLLAADPFDTRLGPGAGYLPWGDDSEMFRRLDATHGVRFAPGVTVRHHIQARRLTKAYVLGRIYRTGRALCVIDRLHQPDFWSRAKWIPVMWLKAFAGVVTSGFSFAARLRLRSLSGYVVQMLLLLVRGVPSR